MALLLYLTLAPIEVWTLIAGNVPPHAIEFTSVFVPLTLALPAGLVEGWLITRSRRGALAFALAAFVLSLTIGHNIPLLGAAPAALRMFGLIALVELVASLVLAEFRRRSPLLSRRSLLEVT